MKRMEETEFKELRSSKKELENKLEEMEEERERVKQLEDKEEMYELYRKGALTLERIIEENLVMKEKLQEMKMSRSHRHSY